jgi:hypothetical protein
MYARSMFPGCSEVIFVLGYVPLKGGPVDAVMLPETDFGEFYFSEVG